MRRPYEDPAERWERLKPTAAQRRERMSDDGDVRDPANKQEAYEREQAYRRGFSQALSLLRDRYEINSDILEVAYQEAVRMRGSRRPQVNYMHRIMNTIEFRLKIKPKP